MLDSGKNGHSGKIVPVVMPGDTSSVPIAPASTAQPTPAPPVSRETSSPSVGEVIVLGVKGAALVVVAKVVTDLLKDLLYPRKTKNRSDDGV